MGRVPLTGDRSVGIVRRLAAGGLAPIEAWTIDQPAVKSIPDGMQIQFYGHPFSLYCQKALIAFYENDVPFEFRVLGPDDPSNDARFAELWPLKRFPIVVDGDRVVLEASIVIEYLQLHRAGPVTLIPHDADRALEVRMMDRFFDNYVSTPLQTIVLDARREAGTRDALGVEQAKSMLEQAYGWLDTRMKDRTWACGEAFSLADCAAAPALFYADWTHRIDTSYAHVLAYRRRLLARPSFARAVDEARPYRAFFPLGAPDRD